MQKGIILLLSLLISGLLFGQTTRTSTSYSEQELRALGNIGPTSTGLRAIDNRYQGTEGTPFLSKNWQKGAFKLKEKEDFGQEVQIKLDLVEQLLYFKLPNGFGGSLPTANIQAFRVHTNQEHFRLFHIYPEAKIEGTTDTRPKFYEVLFDGKFVLLKRHLKEFVEADYKGAYSADRRYDEYVDKHVLWLQEAGKSFHKVKAKRKSLEQALPKYANSIQKVIKSEKLALKKEEDIIQLLSALESND